MARVHKGSKTAGDTFFHRSSRGLMRLTKNKRDAAFLDSSSPTVDLSVERSEGIGEVSFDRYGGATDIVISSGLR